MLKNLIVFLVGILMMTSYYWKDILKAMIKYATIIIGCGFTLMGGILLLSPIWLEIVKIIQPFWKEMSSIVCWTFTQHTHHVLYIAFIMVGVLLTHCGALHAMIRDICRKRKIYESKIHHRQWN